MSITHGKQKTVINHMRMMQTDRHGFLHKQSSMKAVQVAKLTACGRSAWEKHQLKLVVRDVEKVRGRVS